MKLLLLYDTGNPKDFDVSSPDTVLIAGKVTPLAAKVASRIP
jgi:hypothetical protein